MTIIKNFLFAGFGIFYIQSGFAATAEIVYLTESKWNSPVVAVHEGGWKKAVDVSSVFVDPDGFIWSGSSDGLRYFAGGDPIVVPLPKEDDPEAPYNVLDIDQRNGDQGRIWYLVPKGVGWVDRERNEYGFYPHEAADVSFRKFCFDQSGNCWIATSEGLLRMNPETGDFVEDIGGDKIAGLLNVQPDKLRNNVFWLIADSGKLIEYDPSAGRRVSFKHEISAFDSEEGDGEVTGMCQMPDGEILMGGRNLLSRLDVDTGNVTTMKLHAERNLRYREIKCLLPDSGGQGVWIGTTAGKGLIHYDRQTNLFTSYGSSVRLSTTRTGLNCNDLTVDHCGVLWIATKEDGLIQSALSVVPSESYKYGAKGAKSVYRGDIKFISKHKEHLVAQASEGIVRVDLHTGVLKRISGAPRFKKDKIVGSMQMPDGAFLAAFDNKIQRFIDSEGERPQWITEIELPPVDTEDWMDIASELDDRGNLWFARREKVYCYDFEKKHLEHVTNLVHWSDCVRVLDGKVWVATKGHLYLVDIATKEVNLIPLNKTIAVSDIFRNEDGQNEVLLATSEGLFKANSENLTVQYVDVNVVDVRALCEGPDGKLWLAAGGSLRLFDPVKNELVGFPAETEVNIGNQTIQKIYSIDDDRLAIGGWGSIHIFSESNLISQHPSERVPLVLLNQELLGNGESKAGTPFGLIESQSLPVPAGAYGTRFKFGMPDYRYPEMVKFEYQLDQGNWILAENGEFEITNLKSGEHQVNVRAIGSTGQHAKNEIGLAMHVIPPFVETPEFYSCITLALLAIGLLFHRVRTGYVIRTKEQLESVNALLKSSESRYRKIFENSSDAIVMTDGNGTILACNEAARTLLGYEEEVSLADFQNLSCHLEKAFSVETILSTISSGEEVSEEPINVRREGAEPTQTLATVALVGGEREEWQFQFHDVSRQIALEEQIRQAQKMEAVGTLAGGIAHDFNNLLSPIIVHSALAREEILMNPSSAAQIGQSALEICEEAATKAAGLVKNLLHFARKADDGNAPVELRAATKNAIRLLEGSAPSNVKIVTEYPEKSAWICCSEQRLEQALMNIGVNASHAIGIEAGEVRISFFEKNVNGNELWEIRIEDTGCGMSKETLQRVFEPFYTTKAVGEGTGLGLSMVHTFLEDANGTISIESEPGKGTVIKMAFPKISDQVEKVELTRRPSHTFMAPHMNRGRDQILVVDDDRLVLLATTKILEKKNYKVTKFEDPVSALAEFRERPNRYAAVVTDQMMPTMTGLDLAGEIRKTSQTVPIVLLTGFSGLQLDDVAGGKQITEILMKPLDYDMLSQTLRESIDSQSEESLLALVS